MATSTKHKYPYAPEFIAAGLLAAGMLWMHFAPQRTMGLPAGLRLMVLAEIIVGWPVVVRMWQSWRHGSFMNEYTLMVAASIGAFALGEYAEGVAVLLFYSFGEKMEDTASNDVRRHITDLLGKIPDEAHIVEADGTERTVPPQQVKPGQLMMVRPGERVPLDGELTDDTAADFDTSAITGESVPRSYGKGSEILSGMIPVDRPVTIRATRPFDQSSMSRILQAIEDARATKSPEETLLRRITRWYTPVVFGLALLVFVVPWIVSMVQGEPFMWQKWFNRSLVFLVCSCPCALVVSIPLSYFAALGSASRRGLLFKGAKYVDAMRNVDTVMLDKTGTITTGKFHITGISHAPGITDYEVLATVAALDAESTHPLAQAVVAEAQSRKIKYIPAADVRTVTHGITGTVDRHSCAAGSRKLMAALKIEVPAATGDTAEICVARDGKYLGSVALSDTVKPEAIEAIRRLHQLGVRNVSILSGDRQPAVARVAAEVGADSYHSDLLPADKEAIIQKERAEGHKVAFVGDGINDAPAIAAADVGMAMGLHGTGIAMETGDVVIANDKLSMIPAEMRLARKVYAIVVENVSFAIFVKILVMLLGALGIATLWAAVFADTGVTLIVIAYTLLRLRD